MKSLVVTSRLTSTYKLVGEKTTTICVKTGTTPKRDPPLCDVTHYPGQASRHLFVNPLSSGSVS